MVSEVRVEGEEEGVGSEEGLVEKRERKGKKEKGRERKKKEKGRKNL